MPTPTLKIAKEIAREANEEIIWASWLAREAAGKRHNDWQDARQPGQRTT
jgi:hypothetical protein